MAPPKDLKNQLLLGLFIHSIKLGRLEYLYDTAVCVDKSGKIVAVEQKCDQKKAEETIYPKLGWKTDDVTVTIAEDGQFFFPGFIDTHIHAPQYPNVGIFGKSTLLDWLNTYTFPMEASLGSLPKARRVYTRCIRRTLANGTTTAAYYATIHVPSTNLLADLCLSLGQRAFVGRVCMDNKDMGPSYYIDESPAQSLQATRDTIDHIRSIDASFDLISPILTPRFAPACSVDAMTQLGALHRETNIPIQTHIAENVDECQLVRDMFPDSKNYADVYDRFGLLGKRTILAHGIHFSEEEVDLVAQRGSKVSHCPCSNSALTSGVARVRWLLDKGVGVGLGTDVSGGYSPSILDAARQAALVSNHLAMPPRDGEKRTDSTTNTPSEDGRNRVRLSVEEVLHLATRGGAEVVGLSDKIGGFEVGKDWDAQLIGLGFVPDGAEDSTETNQEQEDGADTGNVDIFGWEKWEDRVAKWVFNGDDRNVKKVWVRGRLVHQRK
ncbi:guanine deaminase [Daldinia sp. FL1419]|nr:guanine deaminase [Daldinia sp. FL1419]